VIHLHPLTGRVDHISRSIAGLEKRSRACACLRIAPLECPSRHIVAYFLQSKRFYDVEQACVASKRVLLHV
jgi:hypothetical protein